MSSFISLTKLFFIFNHCGFENVPWYGKNVWNSMVLEGKTATGPDIKIILVAEKEIEWMNWIYAVVVFLSLNLYLKKAIDSSNTNKVVALISF